MSQEDELAKQGGKVYDEFRLEVPYNYYGTRGVVDLVGIDNYENGRWVSAIEYKSESAVKNATGANEIIRQFKKQIEYFTERDDIHRRTDKVGHFLEFYLTQYTLDHVKDNHSLYRSVVSEFDNVRILLRHPGTESPFLLVPEGVMYQPGSEPALEAEGIGTEELVYSGDLE